MAQLIPYLHFNGNCKEAMQFYRDAIGGKLDLQTVGDTPMAAGTPKEGHDKVIHSMLQKDSFTLMASDMMEATMPVFANNQTLCLVCKSKEEIETLFSKLGEGGKAGHPLKEEFFGTFGDLTDKYGFNWMFQFSPNPNP